MKTHDRKVKNSKKEVLSVFITRLPKDVRGSLTSHTVYIVRKILAAKLELQLNADFDLSRVTLDYCNLL